MAVWVCGKCGQKVEARCRPQKCEKCGAKKEDFKSGNTNEKKGGTCK